MPVAALLVGTAACSKPSAGTSPPTGSTATGSKAAASSGPSADELAVWRRFSACMRSNGMPSFPDPVRDSGTGKVRIPGVDKLPRGRAERACESILRKIPSAGVREFPAAELAKLREFSTCMRANGLRDWPDPTADGAFPLPERLRKLGKRGFRDQLVKCRHLVPGKGFTVTEG
jgi:hypothetical protein